MKKIISTILLAAISVIGVQAQSVGVNAESGNRALEQANCWGFGATTYTSTAAQVITGSWSIRSNSPTNMDPGACWVKSPWLKPSSGNVTLNIKFEAGNVSTLARATIRRVIAAYISYDSTKNYGEGSFVRFDSTTYNSNTTTLIPTTAQSLSFAVPAAIANSGLPYKIQLSFVGTGGTTRFNIDDISIPGVYFSDPANSCKPIVQKADADGDGVVDTEDAYPNDATKAYNVSFTPSKTGSTLLFEDAWPNNGDYDFNDLVVNYKYTGVTNANNNLVELNGQAIVKAIGASYQNGFAIQLDNIAPSAISSVSGVKTKSPSWLTVDANGTEAGQTFANIVVIDNVSRLFPTPAKESFINTQLNDAKVAYDTTNFTITFTSASKVSVKDIAINPYLIVNQNRSYEVHLADKAPTTKADVKLFGTADDDSNVGTARFYKNKNNLPWALDVTGDIPYSQEHVDITSGYLYLTKWAQSNGVDYLDWYFDTAGYRNTSNLYTK